MSHVVRVPGGIASHWLFLTVMIASRLLDASASGQTSATIWLSRSWDAGETPTSAEETIKVFPAGAHPERLYLWVSLQNPSGPVDDVTSFQLGVQAANFLTFEDVIDFEGVHLLNPSYCGIERRHDFVVDSTADSWSLYGETHGMVTGPALVHPNNNVALDVMSGFGAISTSIPYVLPEVSPALPPRDGQGLGGVASVTHDRYRDGVNWLLGYIEFQPKLADSVQFFFEPTATTFARSDPMNPPGLVEVDVTGYAKSLRIDFLPDYVRNNSIDGGDLLLWQRSVGSTGPEASADGNGDGMVDHADLLLWETHYGTIEQPPPTFSEEPPDSCPPPLSSIPEPGSLNMLVLVFGGLPLLLRRQCRHERVTHQSERSDHN